jgi:hypothetical protein
MPLHDIWRCVAPLELRYGEEVPDFVPEGDRIIGHHVVRRRGHNRQPNIRQHSQSFGGCIR